MKYKGKRIRREYDENIMAEEQANRPMAQGIKVTELRTVMPLFSNNVNVILEITSSAAVSVKK